MCARRREQTDARRHGVELGEKPRATWHRAGYVPYAIRILLRLCPPPPPLSPLLFITEGWPQRAQQTSSTLFSSRKTARFFLFG